MIPNSPTVRHTFSLALLATLLYGCGGADLPQAAPRLAAQAGQAGAAAGSVQLGQAPTNADAAKAAATGLGAQHARAADGASLAIDTQDREAVRLFYNHLYLQPDLPMAWTGDYASGKAGSVGAAWQAATGMRLNWYRAMAGLPAATMISPDFSAKDQEAALLMSVNGQLSHTPPASWKFYTATAAEAAGSSNLALGATGPAAIDAYIADYGDNNAPVGHRRWIFYPQTRMFGNGDVPPAQVNGSSLAGANALWVLDGNYGGARPRVRDDFVAWPARGYAPYQVVFGRWSLSYPGADFSRASVGVTRAGVPVAATLEGASGNYGEDTIVWQVAGTARDGRHDRPAADVRYHVTVSGVTVGGAARSFEYDVVVFDPAVETAGAARAQAAAPATVNAGSTYTAQVAPVAGATGYALLSYRRTALAALAASDYGATGWTLGANASSGTIASGALHLYMESGSSTSPQVATLNRKLLVDGAGGGLSFTRTLGYATPTQIFRVQLSKDDGASWSDVYSETGKDMPAAAGTVSMSLNAYAGRVVRLRLLVEDSVSRYTGEQSGWTLRDVAFSGVGDLADEREERNTTGTFALPAGQAGNMVLVPRVQYQGLYYGDSGTPAYVAVDGAVLHGPRAWYTLALAGGVLTVTDNAGTDGVQTVRNPYRLDFTDVSLAFDVDGNAGKAYRLYRAALGRQPDLPGLGFWIAAVDGGATLEAMTDGFAASEEFQRLYVGKDNVQLVDALYRNVLGREPDPAGAAFWVRQLANGQPLRALLIAISESEECRRLTAPETALGIAFTRAK